MIPIPAGIKSIAIEEPFSDEAVAGDGGGGGGGNSGGQKKDWQEREGCGGSLLENSRNHMWKK